jgi:hypothetical protein
LWLLGLWLVLVFLNLFKILGYLICTSHHWVIHVLMRLLELMLLQLPVRRNVPSLILPSSSTWTSKALRVNLAVHLRNKHTSEKHLLRWSLPWCTWCLRITHAHWVLELTASLRLPHDVWSPIPSIALIARHHVLRSLRLLSLQVL